MPGGPVKRPKLGHEGYPRLDKWVRGWLLGKQGLSGTAIDAKNMFNPTTKAGVANIATFFMPGKPIRGFGGREYEAAPPIVAQKMANDIRRAAQSQRRAKRVNPQITYTPWQAADMGQLTHEGADWTDGISGIYGRSIKQDTAGPRFPRMDYSQHGEPTELSLPEVLSRIFESSPLQVKGRTNNPRLLEQLIRQMGYTPHNQGH